MRLRITLFLMMLLILLAFRSGWSQDKNGLYPETRKWLLKMDRRTGNKELRQLFEAADARMADLIRALDDPQKEISINAQVIIRYLAVQESLAALSEWYRKQNEQQKEYWMPKVELLSEATYLEGDNTDLAKLVLKNKRLFEAFKFNSGDVTAKLIAYNKRQKAALIELVQGDTFTAGWHAVIKQEGDRWRLMSDNNIWVH